MGIKDGGIEARAGAIAEIDDPDEFARRFERYRPDLLKLCLRILGEREGARDAVNETYLRAYQKRAGFDGENLPGWLSLIARHICIDRIRPRSRVLALDESNEPSTWDDEARLLNAIHIRTILAKLPDAQRRCLKLFYIEGFSAKEVGRETGFTEKQVKSYLQNGRRNFLNEWEALRQRHG